MFEYIEGDIFESPAQVIVNPVNTVGVMGKGLALSFRQRYPIMFEKYKQVCDKKMLTIGKLMLIYEPDHWLLLFPTKENWRNPSRIEYIEAGLQKFINTYADKNITSIAFPRLGCGNGELDWNDVRPLMEKYLKQLPIDVYIYLGTNPDLPPEHKSPDITMKWLRTNAKDMSFRGLLDDLRNLAPMLPYCYQADGKQYEMIVSPNLEITNTSDSVSVSIDDDELYRIWDSVRNQCVFPSLSDQTKDSMIYVLLCHLGYLSRVRIYDTSDDSYKNGYQINSGLGRMLGFEEV